MADISKITLPSGSAYDIKDKIARNMPSVYYGTCSSVASATEKIITISSDQNFILKAGAFIGVRFTNSNTASNITLNVNSTGAKNIWYNNAIYTGNETSVTGYANRVIFYMYDGTNWCVDASLSYDPASVIPLMDGEATVGTSKKYARQDHVHPSDTSRVPITRTINGKALSSNVTLSASDVNALPSDTEIPTKTSDLINDSDFAVDTNYVHTDNNYTTTEKNKLNGIAAGAEVNQNAFSKVTIGTTTIEADSKTDALTLAAGSNITLTPDTTNDKITISATDTTYTPASTAPGKVASASAVGTSTNYARQDHTHGIDLATGDNNGQVKIAGTNVSVKGLGTAAYTASGAYLASDLKGAANGVAQLDANGLVPSFQLPSYVDDVLEYINKASFPTTGQTGKIYVDKATNLTYRWSGSAYVQISPSLALGTTSSTAYRGDYGNTAYTHATDSSRLTTATSSGLYKVAATAQGHIASLTAVTKADITALGIPGQIPEGAQPSSTTPKMNGIAATGTQTTFARGDHVHPTDTSRAAANHTHSAYVNQNAFSNIKVDSTTIAADTTTDTLQLAAGANITLTPDATNDKVTIAAADTTYTASTTSIGSANVGTAISADDITAWTTNTPTVVTKKTVVTGGTTTSITPVTSKTVVTAASGATAVYSAGVLTLTNGNFSTGASVTTGTAVQAYTSLTTGDSVSVTAGKAASLSYTSKSIPNISVASQTVVTGITAN